MESPPGGGFDPFAQAGPRSLRFRTQPEEKGDPSRRRYQAVYSHEDGWSRFKLALDLARHSLTFFRAPNEDYGPLLLDLAGRPPGIPRIPPPERRVDSLSFDIEVIGLKMASVQPRAGTGARSGEWSVVQAFVPGGSDSFLLGVNDRLAAGEIVIARPQSVRAVVLALATVFA